MSANPGIAISYDTQTELLAAAPTSNCFAIAVDTGNIYSWNGSTWTLNIFICEFGASGASHKKGTVPDPGAVSGTTKFLREDATWATTPAGGSPPTGTGFRHITAGVEDAAAQLVLTADITDANVTYAKIQNLSALGIFARSANSAGVGASVTATAASDQVFRESGSTIGWGTIATAGIADAAVTYAKIQDVSAGSKLVGRGDSGSGDMQEITLGTGLAMTGTTLSASGGATVSPNLQLNTADLTIAADYSVVFVRKYAHTGVTKLTNHNLVRTID